MIAQTRVSWGPVILRGVAAGIVGGALIDAYLWLGVLAPLHQSLADLWTYVAVTAAGTAVAANPNAPLIGLAIHAFVSIAWGIAYAYAAAQRPFLNARWYVSGIAYGAIVYLLMQIVLLVSGHFEYPHTPNDFVMALLGHVAAFGLPVAFVVKLMDRS